MPKRSKQQNTSPPYEPAAPAATIARGGPPAWAAAVLLAVSIGAVYCRSLDVPFIFDDTYAILHNPSITSLWPLVGAADHPGPLNPDPQLPTSARPLVNFSFAINYHFGKVSPVGYHAVNVVIHFLTALLVWAIIRRTLWLAYFAGRFESSAGWLALAVAMLWALHPLQTEAVIYATQRTELMCAFFYLATLYCSLRYWSADTFRTHRAAWVALAVIACLAGMASKEVMVSAPVMILLYERTFIAGSLTKAVRQSWPLYVGLASTWLLLFALILCAPHSKSAGFGIGVTAYEWWLTQAKVFWIYLKLVVCPWPLLIHYKFPYFHTLSESWIYVIPTLILGVGTLALLWQNKPIGYLGTWIFAILSPTLIIPIITEIAAERRMYLPLAALVVLFVLGIYSLVQTILSRPAHERRHVPAFNLSRVVLFVPLFALTILLGLASASRLNAYSDDIKLWRDTLRVYPEDDVAGYNLGSQLVTAGQWSKAVDVLQVVLKQRTNDVDVINNLGVALLRLGRNEEGLIQLQHAAQLEPESFDIRLNQGLVLIRAGRSPEAIEQLRTALKITPDEPQALSLLGLAYLLMARYPEAIETLEHTCQLSPNSIEDRNHFASAFARSGKDPQAIEQYRKVLQLAPDNLEAHYNLGLLLSAASDIKEATAHFESALRMQPDLAELHSSYGDLLRKAGRPQEAIERYQTAVRLKPGLLVAYANLAQTLAAVDRSADAIAAAEKAIETARSTHQEADAEHLEEWLRHYQVELRRTENSNKAETAQPVIH